MNKMYSMHVVITMANAATVSYLIGKFHENLPGHGHRCKELGVRTMASNIFPSDVGIGDEFHISFWSDDQGEYKWETALIAKGSQKILDIQSEVEKSYKLLENKLKLRDHALKKRAKEIKNQTTGQAR